MNFATIVASLLNFVQQFFLKVLWMKPFIKVSMKFGLLVLKHDKIDSVVRFEIGAGKNKVFKFS